MFPRKETTIGLALGSGGAKGLAHIGVIKVLEENNIPIDFIAGTSIGALVGGLYAATKDIKAVEELSLSTNWRELLALVDPSFLRGLLGGKKITAFIREHIGDAPFHQLKIPFAAVATDMKKGEAVILREGEVAPAIRASISLPFIFKPVLRQERILLDGGLSLPVPVSVVKTMGAELVIAVNLDAAYFERSEKQGSDQRSGSYFSEEREKIGLYQMSQDVLRLLRFHLANENIKDADLVITPKVGNVGWDKFLTSEKTREVINAGEEAMTEALPQLKELIYKKKKTFGQRMIEFLTKR